MWFIGTLGALAAVYCGAPRVSRRSSAIQHPFSSKANRLTLPDATLTGIIAMPCSLSALDEDAPITAADALGSVVIGVIQARATCLAGAFICA